METSIAPTQVDQSTVQCQKHNQIIRKQQDAIKHIKLIQSNNY